MSNIELSVRKFQDEIVKLKLTIELLKDDGKRFMKLIENYAVFETRDNGMQRYLQVLDKHDALMKQIKVKK